MTRKVSEVVAYREMPERLRMIAALPHPTEVVWTPSRERGGNYGIITVLHGEREGATNEAMSIASRTQHATEGTLF